jgi:hypothetical protein
MHSYFKIYVHDKLLYSLYYLYYIIILAISFIFVIIRLLFSIYYTQILFKYLILLFVKFTHYY